MRPRASFSSLAWRPVSSVKTFRSTLPGKYGHGLGFVTKNFGKRKGALTRGPHSNGYGSLYAAGKRRRKDFGRVYFRDEGLGCLAEGHSLVERRALDPKPGGLEPCHHIVDRCRIAGLAFDLDHRVLGGQPGEDPAVIDLDDIDARLENLGGDRRQRSRLVMRCDMESRD